MRLNSTFNISNKDKKMLTLTDYNHIYNIFINVRGNGFPQKGKNITLKI